MLLAAIYLFLSFMTGMASISMIRQDRRDIVRVLGLLLAYVAVGLALKGHFLLAK